MTSVIENRSTNITCIPENILVQIFQFLPVIDICRIRRVCRGWNRIARDSSLWRHIDMTTSGLVIARVWKILKPNMAHTMTLKVGGPLELNRLSIEKNRFTNMMIKDLCKLCPRLQELHIQDADISRVFSSSLPPTLHTLHIISCVLHSRWFEGLHRTDSIPDLRHLSFSRSGRLADPDVEDICKLFPHLQSLDLSKCYRVTKGLEKVAESLTGLEYLDISVRRFSHHAQEPHNSGPLVFNRILHLMLRNLKKLRVLRVCNVRLQDTAIGLLAGLKSLEQLHMDNCTGEVTDSAFLNLNAAKNLRILSVKNCRGISEGAVRMFKEDYPSCQILHD